MGGGGVDLMPLESEELFFNQFAVCNPLENVQDCPPASRGTKSHFRFPDHETTRLGTTRHRRHVTTRCDPPHNADAAATQRALPISTVSVTPRVTGPRQKTPSARVRQMVTDNEHCQNVLAPTCPCLTSSVCQSGHCSYRPAAVSTLFKSSFAV